MKAAYQKLFDKFLDDLRRVDSTTDEYAEALDEISDELTAEYEAVGSFEEEPDEEDDDELEDLDEIEEKEEG
jgi:hypothetical protein